MDPHNREVKPLQDTCSTFVLQSTDELSADFREMAMSAIVSVISHSMKHLHRWELCLPSTLLPLERGIAHTVKVAGLSYHLLREYLDVKWSMPEGRRMCYDRQMELLADECHPLCRRARRVFLALARRKGFITAEQHLLLLHAHDAWCHPTRSEEEIREHEDYLEEVDLRLFVDPREWIAPLFFSEEEIRDLELDYHSKSDEWTSTAEEEEEVWD